MSLWITGLSVPGDKIIQFTQNNASMCATAIEGEEIHQFLNASYTNIAMARLNLEQYELAVEACDKAIEPKMGFV
ncbi:hypothetical protein THRCLA_20959 [Thraustotheca clavata]|uniref:Uncharacterized protein n=1 Tax=Thraustotheca clavata TaxID=74557 RepID=A0A1W0A1U4_9STRA|nr:hypothetical protein THRCLA_20959 [Thraustotheca clavata]